MKAGDIGLATMLDDDKLVILLTGGGTGGHITPILAVAHQLKRLQPNCQTIYIGERGSKFGELSEGHADIDRSYTLYSGKYRRYFGESWLVRLIDYQTLIKNIRDVLYVFMGTLQAIWLLRKIKPSVVFLKGGYVGVPVGLAAALWRIPIITHDSDAVPGLANRLIGRWATLHATAMPAESYNYPRKNTIQVGVLVEHTYQPVSKELQRDYRTQLKLPTNGQVLLVTGGSSGAESINKALRSIVDELLAVNTNLTIVHQVGKGKTAQFTGVEHPRLVILEFLKPMYVYMGAADLVITRASANTLAELGVQGKPTIVIPSPVLADGHQLRNAEYLKNREAAIIIQEKDLPAALLTTINKLLRDEAKRSELSHKLQHLSPSDAAERLAELILNTSKDKKLQ